MSWIASMNVSWCWETASHGYDPHAINGKLMDREDSFVWRITIEFHFTERGRDSVCVKTNAFSCGCDNVARQDFFSLNSHINVNHFRSSFFVCLPTCDVRITMCHFFSFSTFIEMYLSQVSKNNLSIFTSLLTVPKEGRRLCSSESFAFFLFPFIVNIIQNRYKIYFQVKFFKSYSNILYPFL